MTRERLHQIIFEADTPKGKAFDIALLIAILLSVLVVMLESVESIHAEYGNLLLALEWIFTILFTIEYFLRIYSINKPLKYIFSTMGIIDLLAILPTYLIFTFPNLHTLTVIRSIRIIRIFRVFKLKRYIRGAYTMQIALRNAVPKIIVFLLSVMLLIVILGTIMYIFEGLGGGNPGFQDIPNSIYWSIVTLTTVGYGTVVPVTVIGKIIASVIMLLGYGIIAVPTGIVTAGIMKSKKNISTQACINCSKEGHDEDALYCKYCGSKIHND
tara:strand:+ start:941 stop:1750 length:810 start_codon:yes stop_codon:yes gene_type:complete